VIKIVTDSSCDLSDEILQDLDITMVPLSVRFGEEIFKERVTISAEQFFQRLVEGSIHPATIQPTPGEFLAAYEKVCKEADGIVSIHISSKLSGTSNSALQAKNTLASSCPIEIVDSQTVSIAMGTVVIAAAEAAKQGRNIQEVVQAANDAAANNHPLCLLDTLKFLEKGGRIGKAQAMIGTMLNIKPIITIKDGGVVPYGRARSFAKGMDQVMNYVGSYNGIKDVLIAWTTTEKEAKALAERVSAIYKAKPVRLMRVGTTLGVHVGPGAIILALRNGGGSE
jgi:DegV family protein with EDD domain